MSLAWRALTLRRNANPRERHLPSVSLAVHELSDRSDWEGLAKRANHKFWDEYQAFVRGTVGEICGTKTGAKGRLL